MRALAAVALGTALLAGVATAQEPLARAGVSPSTLAGGIPSGEATAEEMPLSLTDAVDRGLLHNLGLILGQEGVRAAEGAQRSARAQLLPQVRGEASAVREKINLAAFGFSGVAGFPELVGPFDVVDMRGFLSQTVLDLGAIHRARGASGELRAAEEDERNTRDLVVLACSQLYLEAVAGESRITAARAQLETAEALLRLARDRKEAGLAAGIEVLRADVQARAQRQRLIVATEEAAKEKLALARAIGLPLGQRFRLADPMPFAPLAEMDLDQAVARAWEERADVKAARARLEAAGSLRKAAQGTGLPSLEVSADYGAIGNDLPGARATFTLGAALRVPVFEGGRVQGRVREADARVRQEEARLADLRARVYYEVQTADLDLRAAADRVQLAETTLELAKEQLRQAQDRFTAGVASNIDVVQAQESLATAEETRIASLYAHNVAKASLARAMGGAETTYLQFLRGRP